MQSNIAIVDCTCEFSLVFSDFILYFHSVIGMLLFQKIAAKAAEERQLRKRQDWPWYRVKAAVEAKNKTLSAVAIANGLSPSAVHKVKQIPIPRVQKILAEVIGHSPQAVWPTRYDRRGKPVRSYLWVKDNTHGANRNLQKQEGSLVRP